MKHVFVETNFLVDLLRPFPSKDAENLFVRNGADLLLYISMVFAIRGMAHPEGSNHRRRPGVHTGDDDVCRKALDRRSDPL